MKKNLFVTMFIALFAMACSSDPDQGKDPVDGEESVVTLTIYDATVKSRAAGSNIEPADNDESEIDASKGISVVVFNENGTLAYPTGLAPLNLTLTETGPGTGIYNSDAFTITSGQKYFYVFANDANNIVTTPTGTRSQFINQVVDALLDPTTDELDLTDPNFFMGTLWSEKKVAPGNGTPAAPAIVPLSIGRLVSKVILKGVSQGTPSSMDGTFTDPEYRLGTIPKKIFLVGNNDEVLPVPPLSGHGIVTSAVHSASAVANGGDANFQQYTATWKDMDEPFYTVENTTGPDNNGIQYYGNTSYIQIRTVYTPHDDEVYKVNDLSAQGSFGGPTFYTARLISNGARLIFEEDPRVEANNPDPDIDLSTVQVYTNGLNYHKFPIHDPQANLPEVQKNTVLRNHYYEYTVTSIEDIGSPGENVNPVEPIETETTLKLEVKVLPWSRIANNDIPI